MSSSGYDPPTVSGPSDSCATLVINTTLASPKADVVATINRGDILIIAIASDQGPIQALTQGGELTGNITSRDQVKLLGCIVGGTNYIAEVISRNDGECNIQIRPA